MLSSVEVSDFALKEYFNLILGEFCKKVTKLKTDWTKVQIKGWIHEFNKKFMGNKFDTKNNHPKRIKLQIVSESFKIE